MGTLIQRKFKEAGDVEKVLYLSFTSEDEIVVNRLD